MRSGRLTVFASSALIHGGIAALLAWLAVDQIRKKPEPTFIEFEMRSPQTRLPTAATEPPVKPEPEAPEPRSRPTEVPKTARVVQVEKPVPFAPKLLASGDNEAPDDVLAISAPTTTRSFDMVQNVGGGSGEFVSTSAGGTMPVGPAGHGGPGSGGGSLGDENRAGRSDLRVAKDWQVTVLPKPLNDRDFEPDYPSLAKREGREAAVILDLRIDATGKVRGAEVTKGPRRHGFRRAAIAYVRKLRFEPALAGTQPVAARIEWAVYFYVRN